MKLYKRIGAVILMMVISMSLIGCTLNGKDVYFTTGCNPNTLFIIDDMKCPISEAKVYLMNNKNIYCIVDGVDMWDGSYNTDTMVASLKSQMLSHLTKVYSMCMYAKENEIELTEDEINHVKSAAKVYYDSLSQVEKDYTQASLSDIEEMYLRYALALKVNALVLGSVDEEISEDESRIMKAYVLYNENRANIEDIEYMINTGKPFDSIASLYNKEDSYTRIFGRNEYPANVDEVVFALNDGEISQRIDVENGFYYFQCIDKYIQDLSEANKQAVIDEKKTAIINNLISSLDGKYYSQFNQSAFDDLSIENGDSMTSDSFFVTVQNSVDF